MNDDDDELDKLPLFQPSSATGLTPAIARALSDFLCGKADTDCRQNRLVRLAENVVDTVTGHRG